MNAATLTTGPATRSAQKSALSFDNQFLKSRIGVNLREQHCPSCNALIYTRRHGRCGVCERVLPSSFLFSAGEAERLEALLAAERRRHRAWLSRFAENGY
jgi:hypothetical protein